MRENSQRLCTSVSIDASSTRGPQSHEVGVIARERFDRFRHDAGYAMRLLRRSPGFTLADPMLFRPLPYPESDRLVQVLGRAGGSTRVVHLPDFLRACGTFTRDRRHRPKIVTGAASLPTGELPMTKTIVIIGALAAGSASLGVATPETADKRTRVAAPLTGLERQRLVAHLEMTASLLVDEVSGISRAQLEFRPSADAWSIMQVIDHLVVVAPIYWRDLQTAVHAPATTGASRMTDADVLWYGIDRTQREKAIPTEVPKGQWRELREVLDAYREHHTRLVQYIKATNDDLRSHIVERQGCDAFQWALLISTHEQRHILQIREIKAHRKFPR